MKCLIGFFFFVSICDCLFAQTLKDEWVVVNQQGCKVLDPYFSDGVTMKWDGSCVNSKANGFGKMLKYKDGEYESTYEGEYNNGIRKITLQNNTAHVSTFIVGASAGASLSGMTTGMNAMYISDTGRSIIKRAFF